MAPLSVHTRPVLYPSKVRPRRAARVSTIDSSWDERRAATLCHHACFRRWNILPSTTMQAFYAVLLLHLSLLFDRPLRCVEDVPRAAVQSEPWSRIPVRKNQTIYENPKASKRPMCACMIVRAELPPQEKTKLAYATHCQRRAPALAIRRYHGNTALSCLYNPHV